MSFELSLENHNEESNVQFGIVNLRVSDSVLVNDKPLHLMLTIDVSYSMRDIANGKHRQSKLDCIRHTIHNMLDKIKELGCNVSLFVQTFSTTSTVLIDNVDNIQTANLQNLKTKISAISAQGQTNLSDALRTVRSHSVQWWTTHPMDDMFHILLTDGEVNCGEMSEKRLVDMMPTNCANVMIGYGEDHNAVLLSKLSDCNHVSDYRFVDVLEHAGLVYGEILHQMLFVLFQDASLEIENGVLYDYKTNTWVRSLSLGRVSKEQHKICHFRANSVSEPVRVKLYEGGRVVAESHELLCSVDGPLAFNLVAYLYRQQTQELLYACKHVSNANANASAISKLNADIEALKCVLLSPTVEQTPLVRMLVDDLNIASKSLNDPIGRMYVVARHRSNGSQHAYTCTQILYANAEEEKEGRIDAFDADFWMNSQPQEQEEDQHQSSQVCTMTYDATTATAAPYLSPFSSQSSYQMMRDISTQVYHV